MPIICLRYSKLKDAPRLFEILKNSNFKYLSVKVKTLKDEEKWLRGAPGRRRENREWNYVILENDQVVGAIGLKIDQFRKYIGEIGYFLEEKRWGQGITTKAVKLIEKEAFTKLKLSRLEIAMHPKNYGSEKVAIKNGYLKEGLMRKAGKSRIGKPHDLRLYAKAR